MKSLGSMNGLSKFLLDGLEWLDWLGKWVGACPAGAGLSFIGLIIAGSGITEAAVNSLASLVTLLSAIYDQTLDRQVGGMRTEI